MTSLSRERLQELLAKARAAANAQQKQSAILLSNYVEKSGVTHVDFTGTGLSNASIESGESDEGEDAAVELLRDVGESLSAAAELPETGKETPPITPAEIAEVLGDPQTAHKEYGVTRSVTLNDKQQAVHDLAVAGKDVVMIGAAGTGKTTTFRKITESLLASGYLPKIGEGTRWLQAGKPGCVIIAYTRKAVNNIRHAVVDELKANTVTAHKLIEFAPEIYTIEDEVTKELKITMKFVPKRNRDNPLPVSLRTIIFEEGSMFPTELYAQVEDALPHPHQEIWAGDIQQLPPVFGAAILGFKMVELPVIELTEVYRQARLSPILDNLWKMLEWHPGQQPNPFSGDVKKGEDKKWYAPALEELSRKVYHPDTGEFIGETFFHIWQKKIEAEVACSIAAQQFCTWTETGFYDPNEDIILCPFNKSFGTVEMGRRISQYLGKKRQALVYEVIAGFEKHYLAVGDRVLYDKEDAFIRSISRNADYLGKEPQPASINLDRRGHLTAELSDEELLLMQADREALSDDALDRLIGIAVTEGVTERKTASSHDVVIQLAYGEQEEILLSSASEINNLLNGYCITVHKAQGSEWKRVFSVMHHSHAKMTYKELLYTKDSRAREFNYVICECDTYENGVASQRIPGKTWQEKAEVFKGKLGARYSVEQTKKRGGEYVPRKQASAASALVVSATSPAVESILQVQSRSATRGCLRYVSNAASQEVWNDEGGCNWTWEKKILPSLSTEISCEPLLQSGFSPAQLKLKALRERFSLPYPSVKG